MMDAPPPGDPADAALLPIVDQAFLLSEPMRGLRFMMEFMKTDGILRAWDIQSTLVVFGSSVVREETGGDHGRWYREARRFARLASLEGGALAEPGHPRRNVIATGGGPGIMAAANQGAADVGAPSIGFNISLPTPQSANAWSTPGLTFRFHYFAMRKMHLAMRAAGLVVFPGGFGTLDELFEVLTLRQTGKMRPVPVVLVDEPFWRSLIDFDLLEAKGFVGRDALAQLVFAPDGPTAWMRVRTALPANGPDEGQGGMTQGGSR